MITKFKQYESKINYLLCVSPFDGNFYWKFTKGKKYKVYDSSLGMRLKDDNNNFCNILILDSNREEHNSIFIYHYAGGIFTTDNSIDDYEIREKAKKYNL